MESCSNMMSIVLEDIVEKTDQYCKHKLTSEKLKNYYHSNHFASSNKPKMDIRSYCHRLAKYLHVSESCFILALIYIDRLTEAHPRILVNSYTIHRLCLTSVILAMKFNDDAWFSNAFSANVCGITKEELLLLEINFLKLIDYKLMVDPQTFKNYYNHVVEMAGCKAVLSNCSCLNPNHSYKFYSKIIKSNEAKDVALSKCDIKTKDSDSSILSMDNTESSESLNSSKSINPPSQQKYLISQNSENIESSFANNRIMEEELEIASNFVNQGKNTSFNPNYKMTTKDANSNQINRVNNEKSHCVRKSISNISEIHKNGCSYSAKNNKYQTCKHRRHESHGAYYIQQHRVMY